MSDPKITAILVGGAMEQQFYDEVDAALRTYPSEAIVTTWMPEQIERTLSYSPFTYRVFSNIAPNLIGQTATDGILHFIQFGHGALGPSLITQDRRFRGADLVRVFEEGVREQGSPAYSAIILGGCYSGGFGHYFLESDTFTPDFFFGASPPFTVAAYGLDNFFGVALADADFNGDGVLTIRERAVYDMNMVHPLAVMFLKAGSPDIDMEGNAAAASYFPKEVESLASQDDFISMMGELRFGEQAIIYVEGEEAELRDWFENEAATGDGFYKFVAVPNNEETRAFFETEGRSAIFVVGPNLRYHGVELASDRPIGEQIPEIIANENPLMVIAGWRDKISHVAGFNPVLQQYYLDVIVSDEYFDYQPLVDRAARLLSATEEESIAQGLALAKILFESNGHTYSSLQEAVRKVAQQIVDSGAPFSQFNMAILFEILGFDTSAEAERLQTAIFRIGYDRYGEEFGRETNGNFWASREFVSAWVTSLREGSEADRQRAIMEMTSSRAYATREIQEALKELMQNRPSVELRRAISFYLRQSSAYGVAEVVLLFLMDESDEEVKINLIYALTGTSLTLEEMTSLRAYFESLVADEMSPQPIREAAQTMLARIERAERAEEESERQHLLDGFRANFSVGFGSFGMFNPFEEDGTGGPVWQADGLFTMEAWWQRREDYRFGCAAPYGCNKLHVGIMAGLDVGAHWGNGWFSMWPHVGPALLGMGEGWGILFSPQYVLRYTPAENSTEVHHGLQVEGTLLFSNSMPMGISLRFEHDLYDDNMIVALGYRMLFDAN